MSYACSCARAFVSMTEQVLWELTHERLSGRDGAGRWPMVAEPCASSRPESRYRLARLSPSSPVFVAAPAGTQGERRRVRVVL